MAQIELDARGQREYQYMVSRPIAKTIMGECAACRYKIPYGYLAVVTKWKRVTPKYGMVYQVPAEMYCRQCGRNLSEFVHHYRRPRVEARELTPKEMAVKILEMVAKKPQSARKLSRRIGVEYGPVFKAVIAALKKAGRIERDEETGRYEAVRH